MVSLISSSTRNDELPPAFLLPESSVNVPQFTASFIPSPPSYCQTLWMLIGSTYDRVCMLASTIYNWVIKNIFSVHLPNFAQVDDNLYRGAQPSPKGFEVLRDTYGVKTVINLRSLNREELEAARREVASADLEFHYVPISPRLPSQAHMEEILQILSSGKGPFFIHCYFGADRTGFSVALYRIVLQHWEKDKAIQEMVDGGFSYHSFVSTGLRKTLDSIAYVENSNIDESS